MKKQFLLVIFALCTTASYGQNSLPTYVPTSGLVGWWPLDSNANDLSGNANNGAASNVNYGLDRFSRLAKAAYFNGINSVIEVAEKSSQKVRNITISAWAYSKVSRYSQLAYKAQVNNASGENYSFSNRGMYIKNNSNCLAGQGWQGYYYPNPMPVFAWTHICATYDGSNIQSYINGQLTSSQAVTGLIDTCNSNIRFGYSHNNGGTTSGTTGDPWDGTLDDIGLWNRALSQEEIFQLYQQSVIAPPPAGITAIEKQSAIFIWPNPASEQIYLEGASLNGSVVYVTNTMGQLIWSAAAASSLLRIDRTSLGTAGLYFVKIRTKKGDLLQTEKLILQ